MPIRRDVCKNAHKRWWNLSQCRTRNSKDEQGAGSRPQWLWPSTPKLWCGGRTREWKRLLWLCLDVICSHFIYLFTPPRYILLFYKCLSSLFILCKLHPVPYLRKQVITLVFIVDHLHARIDKGICKGILLHVACFNTMISRLTHKLSTIE